MLFKTFAALFAVIATVTTGLASASAAEEVHFASEAVKLSPFREKLAKLRGEALPPPQGTPLIGFLR
jgi:hypothetical protein